MDERIAEIRALTIHSPLRDFRARDLLTNFGDSLDVLDREELEREVGTVDFSDVVCHYNSLLNGSEYLQFVPMLFEKRDELQDLYVALRSTNPATFSELLGSCESAMNTESFWDAHYKLSLFRKTNVIEFSCKEEITRLLEVEKFALTCVTNELREVSLQQLHAFDIFATTEPVCQLQALIAMSCGTNFVESYLVGEASLDKLYALVVKQSACANSADVFFMLSEFRKDGEILPCFGSVNIMTAVMWLSKYFRDVSTEDLLLSYLDLATRNALNKAVNGATLEEALVDLEKCLELTKKYSMYVAEGRAIKEYVVERCNLVCNE